MGFDNPEIPWRELERRLSGRPAPAGSEVRGDGGDSPAWSRKREAYQAGDLVRPASATPFGELHAHSSFSFLDGASSPEELAEEAVRLGLEALTLTDHDGVYGVVRFSEAARELGLATGFGAELSLDVALPQTRAERAIAARVGIPDPPGTHLLALARDPSGYARLSRAIGTAHLRGGAKGRPVYDDIEELAELSDGHWLVLTGCRKGAVRRALDHGGTDAARRELGRLVALFGRDNVVVELTHELDPLADERYEVLAMLADEQRLDLVATTAAHYHGPPRRPLATALAAVRARSSLDEIDGWLPSWAGQHLRSGDEMATRFARWPNAVANATRLAKEIAFPLTLIAPDLPPFPCPDGLDEMGYLRTLTYEGAAIRFAGKPHEARANDMLEHELEIIEELHFPGYFLVVWEIAKFCRDSGILAQGRGSAANSAVCYALGITAIDAVYYELMFERFLAPERGEPPDIDIDIESDRREEVIQHVYAMHGREHAAQVANVISYRPKSAVRDVAKALGYSQGQQDAWSKEIERGYYWTSSPGNGSPADGTSAPEPGDRSTEDDLADVPRRVVELAAELQNAPRHLGIHSGGMVMCDRPVIEVCPVEWGRMANRSVLQWDKDDCAEIGLVKFDLLGLGMLSAIQYCFELITKHHGRTYELATIPPEASCVYDMLCAADSVGVFQVESRAQISTLPRLKPRCFYDLACEVALIRPGPIQGDSVHPFIRRKNGEEAITYPHPSLKPALERTFGIPLFQEQLMQIAVGVADFTPAEADKLRRAMGSKRGVERIDAMRIRLYDGMAANGIIGRTADEIYEKIKAFAAFGFAESHSISFALLVYASSWLKLHYPAAFCAALLNAQPMGFYSPQSLVHDAKRHGVEVRGPSLALSLSGASLEEVTGISQCGCLDAPQPAVRLGLSSVRTIGTELADAIVAARDAEGPFASMADLSRRVGLSADQVEALATAGAFDCFGVGRRDALWGAGAAATARPGQLDLATFDETAPDALPLMTEPEQLIADMWATGVTPQIYPTALIRPRLEALGIVTALGLRAIENRTRVTIGGVVTHRQRPATARGVTFLNLEDETGMINVIVEEAVWQRHRRVARESGGLLIRGMLENTSDGVINLLAERIERLHLGLHTRSRDFRWVLAPLRRRRRRVAPLRGQDRRVLHVGDGFRWKLADDGPPALFGVDELLTPIQGTGRLSGLEFLHVTAKRVLNQVPAGSRAPFRWTINVYRGCSHGCTYCFARPTHDYLGLNIGEDFDRKIVVKINAVERVRAELADPRWAGDAVAMGTNTDPYQRAEAKYRLTRGVVEALAERGNPFSILTKSPLVTRDLDLITAAAGRADVSVNFSIATLDEQVWRAAEPGTPNPRRRIDAMARLSAAGIRTGALVAPVLPGLSDSPEQLRAVVAAIHDAGGTLLGIGPLHLRGPLRAHFLNWLAGYDADLHADYLRRYADGAYAPRRYVDELYRRAGVERGEGRWLDR